MTNELKSKIVLGVTWNTLARFGNQIVQFVLSVILARLLTPTDFGIVAMIVVFSNFMGVMLDFGLGSALVQRPNLTNLHLHSAFWMNAVVGMMLTVFTFWVAPLIAAFYDVDILVQLGRVWSISFVFITLAVVPTAVLQRNMQFKALAVIEVLATVISGIMSIILAVLGLGVWSILLQNISFSLLSLVLKWKAVDWRIHLNFSFAAVHDLWGYTVHLFGFNFINYWSRNVDNLLIGKVFGADALGYYNRAYGLMLLPITQIISVISSVMFSAMSSIQDDIDRVRLLYLRAMSVIALIGFPVMIGLFVTAEPFVLVVYGENWRSMILTLRILSLVGMIQTLLNPTGWIYASQGKTRTMFKWGLYASSITVGGIVMGVWLGSIEMVALLYGCATATLLYPGIAIPGRFLQMSFFDVMRAICGALVASIGMAAIVVSVEQLFTEGWSPVSRLLLMVVCGIMSYTGIVFLFGIRGLDDILDLLHNPSMKWRQGNL
jgi:O-antigen/teichoic acid export membrane protein